MNLSISPYRPVRMPCRNSFGAGYIQLSDSNIQKARNIEKKLFNEYGIKADFKGNALVAECSLQTVQIFEQALGREYLPQSINFVSFKERFGRPIQAYGEFNPYEMSININSDVNCYQHIDALSREKKKAHHFIFNDEKCTTHPLHTFVHEFAHCAHYNNMYRNGNKDQWQWLLAHKISDMEFQDDGGFLGKYAQTNLDEYMAEVLTKEIIENTYSNAFLGGYFYAGSQLKCIQPDNLNCGATMNTYNIWQGNVAKIKENLERRSALSHELDYIEGFMRYDTL